jgi:rRNA maturation RNase YbeY
MEIQIKSRPKIKDPSDREIKRRLKKALKDLGCNDGELSILFTDDGHMAELNSLYLGREGPTNVLAFPMAGGADPDIHSGMLGDIVISVDTALKESEQAGESFMNTIFRLLIHGLLHLLGYDHEASPAEARRMEKEEKRILRLILEDEPWHV